jgi:hypothetical protein
MKTALTILFIFLSIQDASSQNRCRIRVDNKFGFIDTLGQIKIQPNYDYADQFSENRAAIRINGKYGYLDTSGSLVIPQSYEYASYFQNGLAVVGLGGKYGLIDDTGKMITGYLYDWIYAGSISENRIMFKNDDKWGYLNFKGEKVVNNKYESVSEFKNGTAKVKINKLYGIIDSTGNYVLEPVYQMIRDENFEYNVIGVQSKGEGKFHLVQRNGTKLSSSKYAMFNGFSDGKAFVQEIYGEPGYYIDTLGNELPYGKFQNGGNFKEGRATVKVNGKFGIIDTTGKFIAPPQYDGFSVFFEHGFITYWKDKRNKPKYGLMGQDGAIIQKAKYTRILFHDGDCILPELYKGGKDSYDMETKFGYVNREGHLVWKPKK